MSAQVRTLPLSPRLFVVLLPARTLSLLAWLLPATQLLQPSRVHQAWLLAAALTAIACNTTASFLDNGERYERPAGGGK